MLRSLAVLALLVVATDAVWKPMGKMHAHENPERLFHNGDTNADDFLDKSELADFYKHDEHKYHGKAISDFFGGDDKATEALDLNKDGKIDPNEFLKYASPAHSRAVAWDDFDIANKNNDKGLDVKEYKKTHYGKERVIDANHGGFQEHFDAIDANKDGIIDKDEWLSSPAAQDAFSHMDYDGNEKVTLEEMIRNEKEHYHGIDHDHPDAIAHSKEAFDKYDINKDGDLTRAEDRDKAFHLKGTHPEHDHPHHAEWEEMDYDEEDDDDEDEDEDEDGAHGDL